MSTLLLRACAGFAAFDAAVSAASVFFTHLQKWYEGVETFVAVAAAHEVFTAAHPPPLEVTGRFAPTITLGLPALVVVVVANIVVLVGRRHAP